MQKRAQFNFQHPVKVCMLGKTSVILLEEEADQIQNHWDAVNVEPHDAIFTELFFRVDKSVSLRDSNYSVPLFKHRLSV